MMTGFDGLFPVDFTVAFHGSLVLVTPETTAARDWLADHLAGETTWWAGAVAVEPRYVADLLDGAQADGLTVRA